MIVAVVFCNEHVDTMFGLWHRLIATDVGVIVFDRTPKPLHHHIVQGPPMTVHADFGPIALQDSRKGFPSILAALVGIEDDRLCPSLQSFFQALHAKGFIQAVAQFRGQAVTACPVHYCSQVGMACTMRDISDVLIPHLIGFQSEYNCRECHSKVSKAVVLLKCHPVWGVEFQVDVITVIFNAWGGRVVGSMS